MTDPRERISDALDGPQSDDVAALIRDDPALATYDRRLRSLVGVLDDIAREPAPTKDEAFVDAIMAEVRPAPAPAPPEDFKADWIDDIRTGVRWRRVATRLGVPAAIAAMLLFYFGPAFGYGLSTGRSVAVLGVDPTTSRDVPVAPRDVPETQTWLPIGPVRILVPKGGPIAADWTRLPQPEVAFVEQITLHFEGWSLVVGRYEKDAIIRFLDRKVPDSFVAQYVTQGSDRALVEEVMTTLPEHFEWFSGPTWVKVFRTKLNLKEGLFEEIEHGVVRVRYGPAEGYFFGVPGQSSPQRIEVFDAAGTRFSYGFTPGGFHRKLSKLRYAQPTSGRSVSDAKRAYGRHRAAIGGRYRELLRAAMYAAGLAIGGQLEVADIESIRSALQASPFAKLSAEDDEIADRAFALLRGGDTLAELRHVVLGLYGHPNKRIRARAKRYMETLSGRELPPGEVGYDLARRWLENLGD